MDPGPRRRRRATCALVLALALAATLAATLGVFWLKHRETGPSPPAPELGLRWLSRHQATDGSWSAELAPICSECGGSRSRESPVRLTALAVLAYEGQGVTPQHRASYVDPVDGKTYRHGDSVRAGIEYLIAHQQEDGLFESGGDLQATPLATLALTETFGITNAVRYRVPAQRAVRALEATCLPGGGWGPGPDGPADLLATVWALDACKSAEISGLDVELEPRTRALAALDTLRPPEGTSAGDARALDLWRSVRILQTIFMTRKKSAMPWAGPEAALLSSVDPEAAARDLDVVYWAGLACFQWDGPHGASWKAWNAAMTARTTARQRGRDEGCLSGSWDPDVRERPGADPFRARVEATALQTLSLEIYYRYASVFGDKK